jgi:ferredoxin-NADP reductase
MSINTVKLIKKIDVAEGTMAFEFEKPTGFEFKAGQFGDFTLIDPPETDEEGNVRGFSLTNPPYAETLMIATRLRDTAFKRVLRDAPLGTEVKLDAPYGSFTLHNNTAKPAVFLTGGIGITPVRSLLLQATHDQLPHKLFLFYSNRRPEDAAFLDELSSLGDKNPNYKFVGTMTDMANSAKPWDGETGYLTKEILAKHIDDFSLPIYYICGPAAMVAAMRKLLNEVGVDDDDIRTEEFSGY